MSFSSTGLTLAVDGWLKGVAGGIWWYLSADTASNVKATGYFAGMGAGGHVTNYGMRVGDIVVCVESTDGATPGRTFVGAVSGSTADQASTSASSGFKANFNVTVALSTSST